MQKALLWKRQSLDNGEPLLLQSRRLTCDASRKGLPWISQSQPEIASVTVTVRESQSKEVTPKMDCSRPSWKKRVSGSGGNKKVYITTTKKAQFSHMLPNQRDSCTHNNPIIYQPKKSEQARRQEVAPLWYHPIQTGDEDT